MKKGFRYYSICSLLCMAIIPPLILIPFPFSNVCVLVTSITSLVFGLVAFFKGSQVSESDGQEGQNEVLEPEAKQIDQETATDEPRLSILQFPLEEIAQNQKHDGPALSVYARVLPTLFESITTYLNATSIPMSETLVKLKTGVTGFLSHVRESKQHYEDDGGNSEVKDGVRRLREHITEVTQVNAKSCGDVSKQIIALDTQMMGILDIVTSISDVAERIHILSINASIEAARAGTHGRGFKIIADEVQRLSKETQVFVQTIEHSVSTTQRAFSSLHEVMERNKKEVERFVHDDNSTYQTISETLDRQLSGVLDLYAAVLEFISSLDVDMKAFAPIGMLHAIIIQEIENIGKIIGDFSTEGKKLVGIESISDACSDHPSVTKAIELIRSRLTTSRELDALELALEKSGLNVSTDLKRTNTGIEFF
ncbi:MAG: hypothetical protein JW875_03990 [Spirochaetales bacterium]|nr:hypothetical protein [Spirochaetales bacterium]